MEAKNKRKPLILMCTEGQIGRGILGGGVARYYIQIYFNFCRPDQKVTNYSMFVFRHFRVIWRFNFSSFAFASFRVSSTRCEVINLWEFKAQGRHCRYQFPHNAN